MSTDNVIESYLARMGVPYAAQGDDTWIIDEEGDGLPPIVVTVSEPLAVFECRLMKLPEPAPASLLRRLLEINASEMTAGAYGIDNGWVVITDALQSENLDFNEFQAAIDGIVLALSAHYDLLRRHAA